MTIRFGILGAGNWGKVHAEVYSTHPRAKLVAVCDQNEAAARRLAERFGAERVYTDLRDLMDDPVVDAVSIAIPDFDRVRPIEHATRARKHVLVEKPLATTADDARNIADMVERSGITLMVDFHNRWSPPFAAVKQSVERGELGHPVSAYIHLHDTVMVPTRMLSWAGRSSVLWFLGSHCVDILRWIIGDEVESVYAVSRSGVLERMGVKTPDVYVAILQFRNGATATMENCWILAETAPSVFDFRFELVCSAGNVKVDMSHNRTLEKYTKESATYPGVLADAEVLGRKQGYIYESIRHFVDCVADGRKPSVGLADGLLATAVLVAIERSAAIGLPVKVEPL